MDDLAIRLECLKLACAAGTPPQEVVKFAGEYLAFATGDRRNSQAETERPHRPT